MAIIYEPEHILQSPLPSHTPHTNAVTRRQAQARATQATEDVAGAQTETRLKPEAARTQVDVDITDGTNSENEVEELAFAASCSITTTNEHSSTTSSASEAKKALIRTSVDNEKSPEAVPGSPMKIDGGLPDAAEQLSRSDISDATMGSGAQTPIEVPDSQRTHRYIDAEITPAKFYRKTYLNQPQKKARNSLEEPIIIDERPRSVQMLILIS